LEASVVQATASDFLLDAPSRHTGRPGFRRALVHDFNDGLTVNFAGDYPGGVTINGPSGAIGLDRSGVTINGPSDTFSTSTARIILDRASSGVSSGVDQVTIHGTFINLDTLRSDSNAAGDVVFTFEHPSELDQDGNPRTPPFPETVRLGELLTTLRDTITTLSSQVNSLLERVSVLENK
jgi:hypothetical protein